MPAFSLQPYLQNKPKVFLFCVLALLSAYVFYNELVFFIQQPPDTARLKKMSFLLAPHGILGMIALVSGPFQFSTTLRKKHLTLHHRLGKIYACAIFASFPLAILINIYFPIPGANGTFILQNITQALVWSFTTAMAWLAASRRQIVLHKTWAARSYGVTMIFVLSRIYDPIQWIVTKETINEFGAFLWLLMVLALVVPDILIFNKELFKKRKRKTVQSEMVSA